MIEIQHLTKTFTTAGGTTEALKDVSLTIPDGEIYGIIGMSGAGKSTLVRSINMLERPTSGKIVIDGRDMAALSEAELRAARRDITMIFQGFNLLMQRTCQRNVAFPLELAGMKRGDAMKRAAELLELVGLGDKLKNYPSQLSGGQQQRVAIARALATKPKILLCDEATSALDPQSTQSILGLIRDIHDRLGITVIVITHQMSVVEQICTRVAILDGGEVAEEGKVSDVFTNPQSEIARELIIPQDRAALDTTGGKKLRLIFNGQYSQEPIISKLVLECQAPVNIIFADTREFDGAIYGHMIIELPSDERQADKILVWLKNSPVTWKEEE